MWQLASSPMNSQRSDSLRHLSEVLERCPALLGVAPQIQAAAEAICACHRAGGKVLVCGNGGSAADSEHIVGELAKGFVLRRAIPADDAARIQRVMPGNETLATELAGKLQSGVAAISLAGHPALASAVDNDTGREMIFAQQVYVYGRPGDILLALSTSGGSGNILRALSVARAFGVQTIGLTGSRAGAMDALCDIVIKTPGTETHKIQELHLPIYHTICLLVEQELFGAPSKDAE
jgi:D-sedoheptulose 7-phosphate isomerase